MVKLDQTIYVKSSCQDDEVITFGKAPELEESDLKNGISRFGGIWRHPSYTMSYVRAARVLIDNSRQNGDFDQLGLPIFYLSRHALELFIKSILELLYDVAKMRTEAYSYDRSISKGRLKRLSSSHSLSQLNNDLRNTCKELEYEYDSKGIDQLIKNIEEFESNPTWSRYSRSGEGENHLAEEVAIPVVSIHQSLERIVKEMGYTQNSDESSLLNEIYYEWSHFMSRLNDEQV